MKGIRTEQQFRCTGLTHTGLVLWRQEKQDPLPGIFLWGRGENQDPLPDFFPGGAEVGPLRHSPGRVPVEVGEVGPHLPSLVPFEAGEAGHPNLPGLIPVEAGEAGPPPPTSSCSCRGVSSRTRTWSFPCGSRRRQTTYLVLLL
jgi:hypothetical protein